MTDLTMSQFASKDDLIAAQAARIAELEAEVDAERRHHGIRNASAVRTLHALGYSWRGTDTWQPAAPQADVPLPLLVRDIARELGITVPQACIALKPLGNYSTNSAVTGEMARMLHDHFPAPAHPAGGVPAQAETLRAELAEATEAADNWRRLALQFDNHRMQALGHLRELVRIDDGYAEAQSAEQFLAAPPLDGEAVLAQRIAALAAATQPAAQGMDANNSIGTLWVKENDENTLQLCQSAAPKLAPGEYALFAQAKQGVA